MRPPIRVIQTPSNWSRKLIDSLPFIAAFLIGFGSSAHCLGMCGGIAASAGFAQQPENARTRVFQALVFHAGRLVTYATLGLIAGLAVYLVPQGMTPFFVVLRLLAGLLMIAMGLYLGGWWRGLTRIEQAAEPLWNKVQPLLKHTQVQKQGSSRSFRLGLLWGLLPCGLVYSTLAWAATTAASPAAALLMLAMGLGTLPALVPLSLAGASLLRKKAFRQVSSIALVLFGIWTLWFPLRALLAMLSPEMAHDMPSMAH